MSVSLFTYLYPCGFRESHLICWIIICLHLRFILMLRLSRCGQRTASEAWVLGSPQEAHILGAPSRRPGCPPESLGLGCPLQEAGSQGYVPSCALNTALLSSMDDLSSSLFSVLSLLRSGQRQKA